MLLVESPKMMTKIRHAVENGDAPLLQRSAHTLKGSANVFDVQGVFQAANALEQIGSSGDMSEAERNMSQLEDEVAKMTRALESLIKQQ